MKKFLKGNSKIPTTVIQFALLVSIVAGVANYYKPAVFRSNQALKFSFPEVIKIADIEQQVSDPLRETIPPDKGGTFKAAIGDAAGLINELAQKKKEIKELIVHYRTGIKNLENEIFQDAQKKKLVSYTRAAIDKRVELKLRTIQRRRHYIRKLEYSTTWIKSASEELLFLKRKAQVDLSLIDIASGIDIDQHMQDLSAAIQRYRSRAEKNTAGPQDPDIPPLETIWSQIVNPKEITAHRPFRTAGRRILTSRDTGELNSADLSTFHQKISARLPRYSRFIKAAAQKHGFDWQLIAAQIYQESHLNPKARSSAGAKGMMQILPGTARSLGVKDIYNAVENINAGVQHLKTLYDHYESIPGFDRMLLALGAYNAGRGHIEDARRLAVKKNLNPDSWESLTKTLPLLRYRKYYEKSKYGYCRGTEPVNYTKRIMLYYDVLKRQGHRA